jgi:hypothetical protein
MIKVRVILQLISFFADAREPMSPEPALPFLFLYRQ